MNAFFLSTEFKDFQGLFNGKDTPYGSDESWSETYKWLEHRDTKKRAYACLVFFLHSKKFLTTGVSKKGGSSDKVKDKLIEFLPKGEYEHAGFADWATRINVAMIDRVAMIFIHFFPNLPLCKSWITKFGGKIMQVSESDIKKAIPDDKNPDGKTVAILWLKVSRFQSQREVWAQHGWLALLDAPDAEITTSTSLKPPKKGK